MCGLIVHTHTLFKRRCYDKHEARGSSIVGCIAAAIVACGEDGREGGGGVGGVCVCFVAAAVEKDASTV